MVYYIKLKGESLRDFNSEVDRVINKISTLDKVAFYPSEIQRFFRYGYNYSVIICEELVRLGVFSPFHSMNLPYVVTCEIEKYIEKKGPFSNKRLLNLFKQARVVAENSHDAETKVGALFN